MRTNDRKRVDLSITELDISETMNAIQIEALAGQEEIQLAHQKKAQMETMTRHRVRNLGVGSIETLGVIGQGHHVTQGQEGCRRDDSSEEHKRSRSEGRGDEHKKSSKTKEKKGDTHEESSQRKVASMDAPSHQTQSKGHAGAGQDKAKPPFPPPATAPSTGTSVQPAPAAPAQAVPDQVVTAQAVPAQAMPAQATLIQPAPARATPAQAVMAQTVPARATMPYAQVTSAASAMASQIPMARPCQFHNNSRVKHWHNLCHNRFHHHIN